MNIKLLIVNIKPLIDEIVPLIKIHAQSHIDSYVDYCIFRSIGDIFLTPVVNSFDSYSHELVYCQVKNNLHLKVTNLISHLDMAVFYGGEIKAISNGRNLFLTNFVTYD